MIPSWAAWILSIGVVAILGVGLYLLAWHRGYVAAMGERIARAPADPMRDGSPPWNRDGRSDAEAEFFAELLEHERHKPPPEKHRER